MPDATEPRRYGRRKRPHPFALGAVGLLLIGLVCSCSGGRDDDQPLPRNSTGSCTGLRGDQLVLLEDDKNSQNSDNVVPVVSAKVAQPPLTEALDGVSRVLSQSELQGLNRAVTVDLTDPSAAASDFVSRLKIGDGLSGGRGPIVVAAADFSESQVLASVYAIVLKKAGYDASVRRLSTREVLEPALESGEVQVTPEYAASLTSFLAGRAKQPDKRPSSQIDQTMSVLRPLAEARGLTVLDPASANNQNAFAVTKTTADALGVTTLSQLAAKCPGGITLGGPPECPQRPFCQSALTNAYGLKITRFFPLDADGPLTRTKLEQADVLLAEVFSSDADVVSAGG